MKLLTSTLIFLQVRKFVHRSKTVLISSYCTRKMNSGIDGVVGDSASIEHEESSLETLKFVNRAIKSLPVEDNRENYVRTVSG